MIEMLVASGVEAVIARRATAPVRILLAVGLGFATASCGSRAEAVDNGAVVRDSAGITLVDNNGKGLWTESMVWDLEIEWEIGSIGGDPNYEFGQIVGVRVYTATN